MYKFTRMVFVFIFCIFSSSLNIYSMQTAKYSSESKLQLIANSLNGLNLQRKEIATIILSIPKERLNSSKIDKITDIFSKENDNTSKWFENHKQGLEAYLKQTAADAEVKIMGSRRWATNHILSDIDAVVVTSTEMPKQILDALQSYYAEYYPKVEQIIAETETGLYLFTLKNFTDSALGDMKLEYTIQSPEFNRKRIDGMIKKIASKFPTATERTLHSIDIMSAVYQNDIKKELELKQWYKK